MYFDLKIIKIKGIGRELAFNQSICSVMGMRFPKTEHFCSVMGTGSQKKNAFVLLWEFASGLWVLLLFFGNITCDMI